MIFNVRNFLSTSIFDFSAKSSPNSMILDSVDSFWSYLSKSKFSLISHLNSSSNLTKFQKISRKYLNSLWIRPLFTIIPFNSLLIPQFGKFGIIFDAIPHEIDDLAVSSRQFSLTWSFSWSPPFCPLLCSWNSSFLSRTPSSSPSTNLSILSISQSPSLFLWIFLSFPVHSLTLSRSLLLAFSLVSALFSVIPFSYPISLLSSAFDFSVFHCFVLSKGNSHRYVTAPIQLHARRRTPLAAPHNLAVL